METWVYIGMGMILLFFAGILYRLVKDARKQKRREKELQEKMNKIRKIRP